MRAPRRTWSVVLAAGDGTRLRTLTTDEHGVTVPKQFCSVGGGPSLLRLALQRAAAVTDPRRCLIVVSEEHRRWWEPEVQGLPPENVLVQPSNRGTACGLVLPVLHVLLREPNGLLAVIPSDHYVEHEATLTVALMQALRSKEAGGGRLVLLGVAPDAPDTGYGWIRPGDPRPGGIHRVSSFVEKPSATAAERLLRDGALWNSLIFVSSAVALLRLIEHTVPNLLGCFGLPALLPSATRREELAAVYERVPAADFSRDVLQRVARRLRVAPVPPCGWTDLGTPERVSAFARRHPPRSQVLAGPIRPYRPPLDLAAAAGTLQPAAL